MTVVLEMQSDYRSNLIDDAMRERLNAACRDSKRTVFYDLTPQDVDDRNEWTLERIKMGVLVLNWESARDRVGLKLAETVWEGGEIDDDGNPLLDEKGKVVGYAVIPEYDVKINVTREGLTDCEGTKIPKGPQSFVVTREATNRPRTQSNIDGLVKRMPKWGLNGEPLIKDANGDGASEQHRCIAKIILVLTGKDAPDKRTLSCFVEGIHPDIAVTIDTGKSNTGKDIFGSDPELVPDVCLQTSASYLGTTDGIMFTNDRKQERVKVCSVTESAMKLVALRLAGKNVNTSLGNSNEATEIAHRLVSTIFPDMDDLAGICQAFLKDVSQRERPCTASELTAVLALWYVRDQECIDTLPRTGVDGGRSVDSVEAIRFDLEVIKPLLNDICNCTRDGRLVGWAAEKKGKKDAKQYKFAMLARMVDVYFDPETDLDDEGNLPAISSKECNRPSIGGEQNAKGWYAFGGADRGPIAKVKKADQVEV